MQVDFSRVVLLIWEYVWHLKNKKADFEYMKYVIIIVKNAESRTREV